MTGGDDEYGYQDDTPHDTETTGAKRASEMKIIRLASRRMVVTAKKKPKPIVPLFQKPKLRLGVSHRKKK
jgi:hypothetical protein